MTELKVVKFFNRLGRGTFVDFLTWFISSRILLGVVWSAIAIAIFFWNKQNGLRISMAMTIAVGLHFVLTAGLIKHVWGKYHKKLRPYLAHKSTIRPLGENEGDSSFPSSHMSANLSLVSVVVYFHPSIWLVAVAWTLLMGFARLHNGMHYLSDVVAGTVFGILYGIAGIYLSNIILLYVLS